MTTIDWIILGFALLMTGWGYFQGLIAGALALAGFAGGAFLGSRLGPLVLDEGSKSPYGPLFALVGGLLIGGIMASGLEVVGFHLRGRLDERFGLLDGVGGSLLVGCVGLVLAWILGAVALQTPGVRTLREPIQRSLILQQLNSALPPSGPLLRALARFDPFPRIEGLLPNVRPPDTAIARDPEVRAARRSVVKVLGTACGLGVQGSGWVAGEGVVVTNAHVVAGQDDTTVQLGDGAERHDAEAIWFDPKSDLAVLRASGIAGAPELPLDVEAPSGTSAAVLGFPENGPYDVQPGRLGQSRTVRSRDAYGRGPVRRRITALRGLVRAGNSGGPMVNDRGEVVTTIFAAELGSGSGYGFGVPNAITRAALTRAGGPIDTGPCTR